MSEYRVHLTIAGDQTEHLTQKLQEVAGLTAQGASDVIGRLGVVGQDYGFREARRVAGQIEMAGGQAMILPQESVDLEDGRPLQIQVLDAEDQPLSGVTVHLHNENGEFSDAIEPAETTENGRATFSGFTTLVNEHFETYPPIWFEVEKGGDEFNVTHSAFQWPGFLDSSDDVIYVVQVAEETEEDTEPTDRQYRISGTVVNEKSREGLAGLRVQAWDRDVVHDDFLAAATTGRAGSFSLQFAPVRFKETHFEEGPNVFFRILDGDTVLAEIDRSDLNGLGSSGDVEVTLPVPPPAEKGSRKERRVFGQVTRADEGPGAGLTVKAYDRDLRSEQLLGTATTNQDGHYAIGYTPDAFRRAEKENADLRLRVYNDSGRELSVALSGEEQDTVFNAQPSQKVDIEVTDPHVESSLYERLRSDIDPLLEGVSLRDLTNEDIDFLLHEVGRPRKYIGYVADDARLRMEANVPEGVFFGLAMQGIGVVEPETGGRPRLDMPTVLGQTIDEIIDGVEAAIEENQIPHGVEEQIPAVRRELTQLKRSAPSESRKKRADRVKEVGRIAGVNSEAQKELSRQLADGQVSDETWSQLVEQGTLTEDDVREVQTTLSVNALVGDYTPMTERLRTESVPRLDRPVQSPEDLAALRPDDWKRLTEDSDISPPADLSASQYAERLANRVEQQFPVASLIHRTVKSDHADAWSQIEEVHSLTEENPDLFSRLTDERLSLSEVQFADRGEEEVQSLKESLKNIKSFARTYSYLNTAETLDREDLTVSEKVERVQADMTALQTFFDDNGMQELQALNLVSLPTEDGGPEPIYEGVDEERRPQVRKQAMAFQRTLSVAPSVDGSRALLAEGLDSAARIQAHSPGTLSERTGLSREEAETVYRRARELKAEVNRIGVGLATEHPALRTNPGMVEAPDRLDTDLREIDGYADLFGPQDYCDCDHCTSIFGPVAYFVDLMRFVERNILSENDFSGAQALRLENRRPDLWEQPLSCEAATELLPTLTIINEILERYVAGDTADDTTPEARARAAYKLLRQAEHSFRLPFHRPLVEIRIYLEHFGIDLDQLVELVHGWGHRAARESLELAPEEADQIVTPDTSEQHLRDLYGIPSGQSLTELSVQTVLEASGLERDVLTRVVKLGVVNGSGTTLQIQRQRASAGSNKYTERVVNLSADKLDRLHRFVRLHARLPWTVEALNHILRRKAPALFADSSSEEDRQEALKYIAGLRRIQETLELKTEDLIALVDRIPAVALAPDERSLFDRLFNPERLGPEPEDRTRWTPSTLPIFQHPVFAASGSQGSTDLDKNHYRLMSALSVEEETFAVLLDRVLGSEADPSTAEVQLTHDRLSRLYRHAQLVKHTELEIEPLFAVLETVKQSAGAEVQSLQDVQDLLRYREWQKPSPFSVGQVQDLLDGAGGTWTDREIRKALKQAEEAAQAVTFPLDVLLAPSAIGTPEADVLVEVLMNRGILAEVSSNGNDQSRASRYRVTDAFDPTTSLPLTFHDDQGQVDTARNSAHQDELNVLRNNETQLRNLLADHLPDEAAVDALAGSFGISPATFRTLFQRSVLDVDSRSDRLILTEAPGASSAIPSKVKTFFEQIEQTLGWAEPLGLKDEALAFVVAHPKIFALPAVGSAPTLDTVRQLVRYASWREETEQPETLDALLATNVTDATLLAEVLGVSSSRAGSFMEALPLPASGSQGSPEPADAVQRFAKLYGAIGMASPLGVDGRTFVNLASERFEVLQEVREGALAAFRSKYDDEESFQEAFGPFEDRVRERRRTALVDFILTHPELSFDTERDVYHHFLIDPEMDGCAQTSRIVEATGALQLYVHRVLMGLEKDTDGDLVVTPTDDVREQWEWRKNYRVWEANRKIFVYPENYLEPDLRDNKTPLFKNLEDTLLQKEITEQTVETAYRKYLEDLEDVAGLKVRGVCWDEEEEAYHFFGTTNKEDSRYFTRSMRYVGESGGWDSLYYSSERPVEWTPWQEVDLKIEAPLVTPYVYRDRLHLFWIDARPKQETEIKDGTMEEEEVRHEIFLKVAYRTQDDGWSDVQEIYLTWTKEFEEPGSFERLTETWYEVYPYEQDEALHVAYRDKAYETKIDFERDFGIASYEYESETLPTYSGPHVSRPGERQEGDHFKLDLYNGAAESVKASAEGAEKFFHLDDKIGSGERKYSLATHVESFRNDFDVDHSPYPITPVTEPQEGDVQLQVDVTSPVSLDDIAGLGSELDIYHRTSILTVHGSPGDVVYQVGDRLYFLESNVDAALFLPIPYWRTWSLTSEVVDDLGEILMRRGISGFLQVDTTDRVDELPFPIPEDETELLKFPHQEEDQLDFSGPYGTYYRELFLHIPLLLAQHLNEAGKYEAAQKWYHYVFDPTTDEEPPTEQQINNGVRPTAHYWKYAEFKEPLTRSVEDMLENSEAVSQYKEDPFSPHAIARARLSAYQKSVVMRYVDNLLDWGDDLFGQDTRESINQAHLLYTMAADILGPRPAELGDCESVEERSEPPTYEDLDVEDEFDVAVENIVVAKRAQARMPEAVTNGTRKRLSSSLGVSAAVQGLGSGGITGPSAQNRMGRYDLFQNGQAADGAENGAAKSSSKAATASSMQPSPTDAFCLPANDELLGYWDRVEDRLYKIRHCLNLSGERRSLSLFQPPIDPGLIAQAKAAGLSLSEALELSEPDVPVYRFSVLLERAKGYASTVRSFGSKLQSALEKKDAEELKKLKASHQQNILKLQTEVRERKVKQAKRNLEALQESRNRTDFRRKHYDDLVKGGLSTGEQADLAFRATAQMFEMMANSFNTAGSIAHAVPQVGAPTAMTYGGNQVGSLLTALGSSFSNQASFAQFMASMSSTLAEYERRSDRWKFRRDLAGKELKELDKQILAAKIRVASAERELEIHEKRKSQSEEVLEFYEDKFTSLGLYAWLSNELQRLYRDAYNLAHDMARMAQRAYQYEHSAEDEVFIEPGHWNGSRAGLLAGERLQLQLERMEKAHLENNQREYEITQTFSLRQIDPFSLQELRNTGSCQFRLPEVLFDVAYPGQYRRRIRSVRLTIPCVTGPYVNVGAKLRLLQSFVRKEPETGPQHLIAEPRARNASIATSSAENDSGQFQLSFQDGRYVPFEGAGAVSEWALEMPDQFRSFDYDTITDVLVHVSYTAEEGGQNFKNNVVGGIQGRLNTVAEDVGISTLVSLKEEQNGAYQRLFQFSSGETTTTEFTITKEKFPYFLEDTPMRAATGVVVLSLSEEAMSHYTDSPSSEAGPLSVTLKADSGTDTQEATESLRKGTGIEAFSEVPHARFDLAGSSDGLAVSDEGLQLEVEIADSELKQFLTDLRSSMGVSEQDTGPDPVFFREIVDDVVVGVRVEKVG
ncbi:hypothetical protein BSZ35_17950 [Salinibacter sp. 10B]|uniref:Tc toxin subunit A-related protein n=1 Tax=Salinibacter sp. 10B TaxID=1923971 RepID=UPI000CF3D130|nr:neuraminidase-like domain-containing protein [Salinibacter sp. 10B]PQJ26818.1 hypothetical protein BSZ35_17950 [Salinibacter sp. 10B]